MPSIPSVGLKVALKAFEQFKTLDKVIENWRNKKKDKVPDQYENALTQVQNLFYY